MICLLPLTSHTKFTMPAMRSVLLGQKSYEIYTPNITNHMDKTSPTFHLMGVAIMMLSSNMEFPEAVSRRELRESRRKTRPKCLEGLLVNGLIHVIINCVIPSTIAI